MVPGAPRPLTMEIDPEILLSDVGMVCPITDFKMLM